MAFPGLQHVAITVSDLDASTQWYTRLFGADPVTGERGKATDRLDVEPNALVFSYEHQVLVEASA